MTAPTPAPDMAGLVERLQRVSKGYYPRPINPDGPEAAARIRDLEAENARLRERLRYSQNIVAQTQGDVCPADSVDLQRAFDAIDRAALSGRGRG